MLRNICQLSRTQKLKNHIFKNCIRESYCINMDAVPLVDIDPQGAFKYILIKLENPDNGELQTKNIVRGYGRCKWHSDIFEEVKAKLAPLKLTCLGGGKISHDPESKDIKVYSYSQGYGKADHEVTVGILKQVFPSYTICTTEMENV